MRAILVSLLLLATAVPAQSEDLAHELTDAEVGVLLDLHVIDAVMQMGLERQPIASSTEWLPLARFVTDWPAVYRSRLPFLDPWDRPYSVRGLHNEIVVASYGPNGLLELDLSAYEAKPDAKDETPEQPEQDEGVVGDDIVLRVGGGILNAPRSPAERAMVTMADLRSVGTAVEEFSIDNERYPEQLDGLLPIETIHAALSPLYIRDLPAKDVWGHEILYWSDGSSYVIVSVGSDGVLDKPYVSAAGLVDDSSFTGAIDNTDADIIFANGQFVQWLEKYPQKADR